MVIVVKIVHSYLVLLFVFFFKQKTAYEMRISDWSSDVCSSDLVPQLCQRRRGVAAGGVTHGEIRQCTAFAGQPDTAVIVTGVAEVGTAEPIAHAIHLAADAGSGVHLHVLRGQRRCGVERLCQRMSGIAFERGGGWH